MNDLVEIKNDFSEQDSASLKKFIEAGCPGLAKIAQDEPKVMSMFSMYMSGKSYEEIGKAVSVKKELVLYFSHKMKWYDKKMSYLNDIQANIAEKIKHTKTESFNFIANLLSAYHKYYGDQINKYLSTNNSAHLQLFDLKELNTYFKSVEMLEKLLVNAAGGDKSATPQVQVNIGNNAEIKKVGDNSITIEAKDNPNTPPDFSSILRALAEMKESDKKQH